MAAVSNSSPLIALSEIGQLDLLPQLFTSVLIPPAVAGEIAPSVPVLPTWVEVRPVTHPLPQALRRRAFGLGEREALALSLECRPSHVILDDLPARRLAVALGLPLIGTLGVLVAAKHARLIDLIRPQIDGLVGRTFFIGDKLYRELLEAVGEPVE